MIIKCSSKRKRLRLDTKNLKLTVKADEATPIASGGFDYTLNFSFQ